MLESRGIPTVTIATTEFEDLFHLEAEQRGMPSLPYVVVPHPIGGVKPEVVREKALATTDDLLRALVSS